MTRGKFSFGSSTHAYILVRKGVFCRQICASRVWLKQVNVNIINIIPVQFMQVYDYPNPELFHRIFFLARNICSLSGYDRKSFCFM